MMRTELQSPPFFNLLIFSFSKYGYKMNPKVRSISLLTTVSLALSLSLSVAVHAGIFLGV
jgi:hypothetical protein